VKRWICTAVLAAAPAAAAPARDRCESGARFAREGDLSRAALYLDGCDEVDGFERATQDLKKKLEASQLSKLEIVTTPAGLIAEVDALPGEHLTTPVTVWVRAGHHVVRAGDSLAGAVDVKPHSHATVVLAAPKDPPPPRTGRVDFNEDNASDVTESSTLPDVQHRPMLNCKYTASCPASGEHLDDPLALHASPPPEHARYMLELRAGASAFGASVAPTLAAKATLALGATGPKPWLLAGDVSGSRGKTIEDVTGLVVVEKVFAAPDTSWLSLGLGGGYSSGAGLQGAALVELALRQLPLSIEALFHANGTDQVVSLQLGFRLDVTP
jgi:hypothetical protein